MAKHARAQYGADLMSHLIERQATSPRRAIPVCELARQMNHPADLWEVDPLALPTAWMAEHRGLEVIGYGRNLGQVWAGRMSSVDPVVRTLDRDLALGVTV
jgi:hypothetical protein